jgi:hypothetical protein
MDRPVAKTRKSARRIGEGVADVVPPATVYRQSRHPTLLGSFRRLEINTQTGERPLEELELIGVGTVAAFFARPIGRIERPFVSGDFADTIFIERCCGPSWERRARIGDIAHPAGAVEISLGHLVAPVTTVTPQMRLSGVHQTEQHAQALVLGPADAVSGIGPAGVEIQALDLLFDGRPATASIHSSM